MSRPIPRRPGLARRAIAGAVAAVLLAGCGSDGLRTGTPTRPPAPSLATPASTTTTPPTTAPPTTAPTDEPGWVPATEVADHIVTDTRTITTPAGAHIDLVRARAGTYRLDLHVGSVDPTGGTSLTADEGDAISVAERPQVVAAFNGGFKTAAGGIEVGGHVLTPLVAGDASLVIDQDGTARIGVWDQTVPIPGEQVDAVRQDLRP